LFLFTNAGHVSKTIHNSISVRKLVEHCLKNSFCDVLILIILIFKYLYFTR